MSALDVTVLCGGDSPEAEVSRVSGREVANGLEAAGHRVERLELDRDAARRLLDRRPDVVFPALHGPPGEDGTVQGLLEMLKLPYVGSDVHGSAMAMNKVVAKALFERAALPLAADWLVMPGTAPAHAAQEVLERFGAQVAIKPLRQGSALGVTLVRAEAELERALAGALAFGDGVLVEPLIEGHEITAGVLDLHGQRPRALPVIEIRTAAGEWYDYRNRYTQGRSEHLIPAPLPEAVLTRVQQVALEAHTVLGLRDLSRADLIVTDAGELYLLEVNTLPGMTPTSLYPDAAAADGLAFSELVDALVRSAVDRSG